MATSSIEVLDFIERRFPSEDKWIDGNCYYFTIILKARFPQAIIYYDTLHGHFFVSIDNINYDWAGLYYSTIHPTYHIKWDEMDNYDPLVKERIVRDCIM